MLEIEKQSQWRVASVFSKAIAGLIFFLLIGCGAQGDYLPFRAPQGKLDLSFGKEGLLTTSFGSANDGARAILVLPDRRILAGGFTQVAGGEYRFAIARYNEFGQLDPSFSGDGKLTFRVGLGSSYLSALALGNDESFFATGYARRQGFDFATVKFRTNGTPDSRFGNQGSVVTSFSRGSNMAEAIAVQPNGSVLVGGYANDDANTNADFAIVRYLSDGSLDPSFGTRGRLTTDLGGDDYAHALLLQPDGKILLAGESDSAGSFAITLARYLPTGILDPRFSEGGIVRSHFGEADNGANALALQPDGKIIVAGHAESQTDQALVARYLRDGSLDRDFGDNGVTLINAGTYMSEIRALTLQPDGAIIFAGYSIQEIGKKQFLLGRLTAEGKLDSSFGETGGWMDGTAAGAEALSAVDLSPDGAIVAAGSRQTSTMLQFSILRAR